MHIEQVFAKQRNYCGSCVKIEHANNIQKKTTMENKCKFEGKDKLMHFGVCFAISILSTIAAIIASLWKEYKDSKTEGNHWCWNDLLADALGIVCGSSVRCLLIYFLF